MTNQIPGSFLSLRYQHTTFFIFLLLRTISNGVCADSFCDSMLDVESFEKAATHRVEFQSVGHLLVQGRSFFETDLDYISFSSAHYFGQDTKGNYYATTSAHTVEKFQYFQSIHPELILYLSLDTSSANTLLTVVESFCHPNHLGAHDTPYQYDVALLKLKLSNPSGTHNLPAPTPLDLREIPVPEDSLPLYAIGFGPKGWVGGALCQYNGHKHGVYVYASQFMTQELSRDDALLENSWLSPLSYCVKKDNLSLRPLKPLEGGLNHGMSGSTCFRDDNGKTYATAITTAIIPAVPSIGEPDLPEEEDSRLISARLTGHAVSGLNPKKGQIDIIVPYYVMKDFFITQMKKWGIREEELQKFFIFSHD